MDDKDALPVDLKLDLTADDLEELNRRSLAAYARLDFVDRMCRVLLLTAIAAVVGCMFVSIR